MIKSAISFLLGCVLLFQFPSLPDTQVLSLLLVAVILVFISQTRWLAILIIGFSWTYYQTAQHLEDRLTLDFQGQAILIMGTVDSVPDIQHRRIRFEFSPDKHPNIDLPNKILLNWYQPIPNDIYVGERWQLLVRLKQPFGMKSPGSFDYESWLFQQKIGATGYIRNDKANTLLKSSPTFSINGLREKLSTKINQHLSDSGNLGIIQGLTTGIRQNISPQQWEILRLSGTNHLLAISGLHIGLAAAIGFFSFRFLWSRRAQNLLILPAKQFAAIGGFSMALFYAALAGFSIPTQRALIMVTLVMISLLLKRPISLTSTLSFSLILILIWDPFSVLSAGFWLSFSAVAIILFTCQNRFPKPKWQWGKIHIFIAFGLTPLLLVFFSQVSLVAPIANVIAVPFISFVIVPLSLLASLMLWLVEPIGLLLLSLIDSLLTPFWIFLEFVIGLPFSHWSNAHIPWFYFIPITIGIALLLSPRGFPAKYLGILGLLPLILYSPERPDKGEFWFSLLDVGQGLSAVIQTHRHTLVFDTGPKFSDKFNTGSAVVLPYLQSQGIRHLDKLIISHGDNDHIGGAQPLIDSILTNEVLTSVPETLLNSTPCTAGQSWSWDAVTFTILAPKKVDHLSSNNKSCVLHIKNSAGSVLLTGDIEKQAESWLMDEYGKTLNSSLLVAPHHGSKTSSTAAFIDMVNPKTVLFPVGYRNRYHFPNDNVKSRYQQRGITSFNTAKHGAIIYRFSEEKINGPITWRQHDHKIWTATTD